MVDTEGDEDVGIEVGVHVGVQVGAELALAQDVGLHDGLAEILPVVLGLAHQGLRDGGYGCLPLDPAVRIDVGDLRIEQAEHVDHAVAAVDVAGQRAPDHLEAVLIRLKLQVAQSGEVGDEVARSVVRRSEHVVQLVPIAEEVDDEVLLLVEVELSECLHAPALQADRGDGFAPPPLRNDSTSYGELARG